MKGCGIYRKITIDGPAGSGKSSLAKALSKELNIVHLDTGAIYRTIALYFLNKYYKFENVDENVIINEINNINIEYNVKHILLNGNDVSNDIRSDLVSQNASKFSSIKSIREFSSLIQKKIISETNEIILDGRDSGTVIMPEASSKFFLKTSAKTRAKRRLIDQNKEITEENLEFLIREIEERDLRDSTREIDPLIPAEDALIIDNSTQKFEQTLSIMLNYINR